MLFIQLLYLNSGGPQNVSLLSPIYLLKIKNKCKNGFKEVNWTSILTNHLHSCLQYGGGKTAIEMM